MALRYRTITGTIVNPQTGDPASGTVRFQLKASDFDVSESSVIDQKEYEFTLDGSGNLPTVELWCTGDGDGSSFYRFYTPSGECYDFTLDYDAASIDIATLIQQGAQVTTPSVVGYLGARLVKNLADYTDLPTAVSSIGATECRLRIASAVSLTANLTIPDNIAIEIIDEGEISVGSGYTCTIHNFVPAQRKVFAGVGDVILEKNASGGKIDLTWWAGQTNASDVTHELEQAIASASANTAGVVRIPSGTWKTTSGRFDRATNTFTNGLLIPNNVIIKGDGSDADGASGSVIELTDTNANAFIFANATNAFRNIKIQDVALKCPSSTGVGVLLHGQSSQGSGFGFVMDSVAFKNGESGIQIRDHTDVQNWENQQVVVRNCEFNGQANECFYANSVNSSLLIENNNFNISASAGGLHFDHTGVTVITNNNFAGTGSLTFTSTGYSGADTRVPNAGANYAIKLDGSHVAITVISNQDESLFYSFINNASDYTAPINWIGNLSQGWMQFNQSCPFNSVGNQYQSHSFRDSVSATAKITSTGDSIVDSLVGVFVGATPNTYTDAVKTTATSATIGVTNSVATNVSVGDRVIINNTEGKTRRIPAFIQSIGASDSHSSGYTNVVLEDGSASAYTLTTTSSATQAKIYAYLRKLSDWVGGSYISLNSSEQDFRQIKFRAPVEIFTEDTYNSGEDITNPVLLVGGENVSGVGKPLLMLARLDSNGNPINWFTFTRNGTTGFLDILGSQAGSFSGLTYDGRVLTADSDALATGASPVTLDCSGSHHFTWTPDQSATVNASNVVNGQSVYLVITTSGTTDYTITFGTNFKSSGTLATGTTDGAVHVVEFISSGGSLVEVNRTTGL